MASRLNPGPLDGGDMIGRLIAWWKSSRAWSADHHATWPRYTDLVDGRSLLIAETEAAILTAAGAEGFELDGRVEEAFERSSGRREVEVYVRFKLSPSPVEVWLYSDAAQVDAPLRCRIFEEWGFRTPHDFIREVTEAAIEMARQESPPSDSARCTR